MLNVQDLLADKLEKLLILRGWSHADLARQSHVNVAVIRDILKKRAWPGVVNIRKIATAFEIPESELFNPETPAKPVYREHKPEECFATVEAYFKKGIKPEEQPSPIFLRISKLRPDQLEMLENALNAIEDVSDLEPEEGLKKPLKKGNDL